MSLVCAFLFAPLGIIFGHISLSQIKQTGEEGRGLAVAGLVISYLITVAHHPGDGAERRCSSSQVASDLESLDGLTPELPGHHGDPVAAPTTTCRSSTRRPDAGLQLPISGDDGTGEQARQAAAERPGRRPIRPSSARASPPTGADIGLQLDNGKTPCTVNNFASLAQQGFFDDTTCHRLTTIAELGVLQCGDPTGNRHGRSGLPVPERVPDQPVPADRSRAEDTRCCYPRGTLAMANSGPGTNGSQFFLVYKDSQLPPTYTVFGTIDSHRAEPRWT